jgi:hypothetical protein
MVACEHGAVSLLPSEKWPWSVCRTCVACRRGESRWIGHCFAQVGLRAVHEGLMGRRRTHLYDRRGC